jgi:MOSC domain-containing protein YiiM
VSDEDRASVSNVMRILAVCIGHPETLPGKRYKTGIDKHPIVGPLKVSTEGLEGDAVCDRRYHGGPDQAIYVEGAISLKCWCVELGAPIAPGEFGENLVIDGLDNEAVAVGDRFAIGEVILEATAPRMPCATFAAKMDNPHFVKRYRKAERPGFYCSVIRSGELSAGLRVNFQAYGGVRISMPEMMRDYGKTISGDKLDAYLSAPIHHKLRASLVSGKVKF